jgi:hypothetical protein
MVPRGMSGGARWNSGLGARWQLGVASKITTRTWTPGGCLWMPGAEAIPEVRLADEGIRHVLRYSWMSHMIAALQ